MVNVNGVEVFHWNPRRRWTQHPLGRYLPKRGRVNNFGDMLGPAIVRALASHLPNRAGGRRLLTVGSIMHFARDGDVIWGAGINGKVPIDFIVARDLDIRAVRGPLTAEVLSQLGMHVPDVYGDPGLLAPSILGVVRTPTPELPIVALPNLHDIREWRHLPGYFDPRVSYRDVIQRIADSEQVVTSSLHGVVIADALRVPVSLVRPGHEDMFKYEDYYEGTGRRLPRVHDSFVSAIDHPAETLRWDARPLLAAFPYDLWGTDPQSS